MFRSRQTGRISVVAWPNAPLWVWIVARAVGRFLPGVWEEVVSAIGTAALVVWAAWELWRGVSPFRRLLGAAVLVWLGVSSVSR